MRHPADCDRGGFETMTKHWLCVVAALWIAAVAVPLGSARAVITLTLEEDGLGDVTFMGSGTFNPTGLVQQPSDAGAGSVIRPAQSEFQIYPVPSQLLNIYTGVTAPANFGNGGQTAATGAASGFVISYIDGALGIDERYVDGDAFSTSVLFPDTDLESLGVTPGTYTWSWGGDSGDSIVLNVMEPIPEPAGVLVAMVPVAALVATRRRPSCRTGRAASIVS
jgi:hypothetical protein